MSFARPTLKDLAEEVFSDVKSRLKLTAPLLQRSLVGALSRAQAGQAHGLYGYLQWMVKQQFVHLCDDEFLDLHGTVRGIPRKPASTAIGRVRFEGRDGAVIPEGTRFQFKDRSRMYRSTLEATLENGAVVFPVEATAEGRAVNIPSGSAVTLLHPIPGVISAGTVADGGITGGADVEGEQSYRDRILDYIRRPPHGGSANDYKQWALEVPGVARVWVFPAWAGLGTVGVMIAMDADDPSPNAEMRERVQRHIDERRPVTAEPIVFVPVMTPVNFAIKLFPDTEAVRLAVSEELRDYLLREGAPNMVLYPSRISEVISAAIGEHHHELLAPAYDHKMGKTELPVLGIVTHA